MSRSIQRIRSYLAPAAAAQERISDLLTELRDHGLSFDVQLVEEDGQRYLYAQSIDYPRGYISATGSTPEELEVELKDAIFTAFGIPPRYCNPDLIAFTPRLSEATSVEAAGSVYATT
jgi:hypothetical protein